MFQTLASFNRESCAPIELADPISQDQETELDVRAAISADKSLERGANRRGTISMKDGAL